MQPPKYHETLLAQIQQTLGPTPDMPEKLQALLKHISDTYDMFDASKKQLEATVAFRTEQLIASTSRAYSFLDSLNMGLMMCDINPEVVLTNVPFQTMLASKQAAAGGAGHYSAPQETWNLDAIDTLLKPEIELKQLVLQSLTTNLPQECPEVNVGQRVMRFFIAPMINETTRGNKQQIGAVILAEDITEQKVLERSKDEFLSIASHELRTPLTAIRGNSAMIAKYYADSITDKDMAEMINDIHESSIRLIGIVNDFLDLSALEQGKMRMNPETFALKDVVDEVAHDMQTLCDAKGVALVCDASVAAAPAVVADRQRTKQVVYNLVGNSLKFTDHGSITISTRTDEKFVYITVSDTGRGMSAENQRLLFRKFQQAGSSLLTRDTTKGTGLGLYISKLIVELSNGTIGLAHSELGKGSAFVFSLPRPPHQDKTAL